MARSRVLCAFEDVSDLSIKAQRIVESINTTLSENRQALERAFKENQTALDKALRENRTALNASRDESAAVLKNSIEISQDEQRAWLGLSSFDAKREQSGRQWNVSSATLLNSGRTPALDVAGIIGWIGIRRREVEQLDARDEEWMKMIIGKIERKEEPANEWIIMRLLPPRGRQPRFKTPTNVSLGAITPTIPFVFKLPEDWSFTDDVAFVLFGQIKYNDVFDRAKRHTTLFCSYQRNPGDPVLSACPIFSSMN